MKIKINRRTFLKMTAAAGIAPQFSSSAIGETTQVQALWNELDYYYSLFTDIAYNTPVEPMRDIVVCSIAIYDHKQPWFEGKDFVRLLSECRRIYRLLRSNITTVKLAISSSGLDIQGYTKPLNLTNSMSIPVLIQLYNQLPKKESFTVSCDRMTIPAMKSIEIDAGSSRAILIDMYASDTADFRSVGIDVASKDSTGNIKLPVQINKPAKIKGVALDKDSGKILPAKISACASDQMLRYPRGYFDNSTLSEKPMIRHLPIGKSYRLPFFYTDGSFELEVPSGEVTLTIERGYEYTLETKRITVEPGKTYDVSLGNSRFIDMKESGWYSGDTHIHWAKNWWSEDEKLSLLAMVQRAEGLRVANNLTLYQYRPEDQGGSFVKPAQDSMGPVAQYCNSEYHIQMAEEYRNDNYYGHLNFLNIKHIVEPIAAGPGSGGPKDAYEYPLNKSAISECRRQGGISIEAHNLGPMHCSDVPVNVITGNTDSLDQLMPENYYRFLDCGIRMPLTNGSDHPARPAGECRAYVKIDGDFTYQKWIDGIKAKRTFTTSGPLIFLTVNGMDIGQQMNADKGDKLLVMAKALSRHPIGKLQILSNTGEVLKEVTSSETSAELTIEMNADESRWFVARCSANDNYYVLDNYDAAHTSAIYVDVDGKKVCNPDAVNFWIKLLQRHKDDIATKANYEKEIHRQEQIKYIDSAIELYRKLL
ncbi:MAG: CehA/McbA family metallohydrolase [Sedimentisphaeraceae bacterium JB056]